MDQNKLFSKIFGCEMAGAIGNALGDKVEGRSYQYVEETYGLLDRFVEGSEEASDILHDDTYDQYRFEHKRAPGATEDGFERHKLCATAIIRKGGHIDADDLAKAFARQIDTTKFGYLLGWQDQFAHYSARAGIKGSEVGEFASWPGKIGTSKMIMPIGMLNAGNPEQAYKDAVKCARIKDAPGEIWNHGVETAGVIAAAVAEALRPDATYESVIETALSYCSDKLREEVNYLLNAAKSISHWKELRPIYNEKYEGKNISMANEILSAGIAVLYLAKGNPVDAIIIASNIGRDTDCKAYVAGGLAGALTGVEALPEDWIKLVEEDTEINPFTLCRQTSRERAKAIYSIVLEEQYGVKQNKNNTIDTILRDRLDKPADALLTAQDYQGIYALDIGNRGIKSLEGIEKLTNLTWLKADQNEITDISPLRSLTKLESLDLGYNQVSDINALEGMNNLQSLFVDNNNISDISVLSDLSQIRFLNLANNQVSDLSALSNFENLHALLLENNQVSDIEPIANNINIFSISLDNNKVKDISVVGKFTKLIALYLKGNQISDISALSNLQAKLKCLTLDNNLIADGSPLGALSRLITLTVSGNTLEDISFIDKLVQLRYLEMDNVGARSITGAETINHLSAANNLLTSTSGLEKFTKLHYLNLSSNKVTDIKSLANLSKMKYLYLGGNQIEDYSGVTNLSVLEDKDF